MNRAVFFGNGTSSSSSWKQRGKVVFTFDEPYISQYSVAYPLLKSMGISATFYVNTDQTTQHADYEGYLGWNQYREMHSGGMDIQCHSKTHSSFTTLSEAQIIAELESVNATFASEGLPIPQHIGYPGGYYNFAVKSAVSGLRKTGRVTDNKFFPLNSNSDKLSITGISIDHIDDPTYMHGGVNGMNVIKGYLDQVAESKGAIVFYSHGVSDNGAQWEIALNKLIEIINYARSIGIKIMNISQLYRLMDKNPVHDTVDFTVTAGGDGSGSYEFVARAREDTVITLNNNAKFYDDAACTTGESSIYQVSASPYNYNDINPNQVRYIKCTSGSALLTMDRNLILHLRWGEYTSANRPILSGDISLLPNIEYLSIIGNNTITGNITIMTLLKYLAFGGVGLNTISGDLTNKTQLTYLNVDGANTLTGNIENLINLIRLLIRGNNTVTGDIGKNSIISNCNYVYLSPCRVVDYTSGAVWPNATINIAPSVGYGYSCAEIDAILIDMAASPTLISKTITLTGSNAVRTAASNAAVATLTGAGRTNTLVLNT